MARRRRRSIQPLVDPLRDLPIAITRLVLHRALLPEPLDVRRKAVRDLEDRRRYHPLRTLALPAAVTRNSGRIVRKNVRNIERVAFAKPHLVSVCVKRKERKEVLHAKKLVKRRGRGGGSRRWSEWSDVRCK